VARVFCGDEVDFFQGAQGVQGDVLEITDGGGNDVKHGVHCNTKSKIEEQLLKTR